MDRASSGTGGWRQRMASRDRQWALDEGQRVGDQRARIQAEQQQLQIDLEIRATRRRLLTDLRQSLRVAPRASAWQEFLAVADRPLVLDAILIATCTTTADACDLRVYEPDTRSLHLVRQRGLSAEFLHHFATIDTAWPTVCGTALATRRPVIIDDVTRSVIFAGRPTLPVMLAAGTRAVQSYPLLDRTGDVLGVLTFHYPGPPSPSRAPHLVVQDAATALRGLSVTRLRP